MKQFIFCLSCGFCFSSHGISDGQAMNLLQKEFGVASLYERPLSVLVDSANSNRKRYQAARELAALPSPMRSDHLVRLLRMAGRPGLSRDVFSVVAEKAREELKNKSLALNVQMEALELIQTLADRAATPKRWSEKIQRPSTLLRASFEEGWPEKFLLAMMTGLSYPSEAYPSEDLVALKSAELLQNPRMPSSTHGGLLRIAGWGRDFVSDSYILAPLLSALVSNENLSLSVQEQIINIFTEESGLEAVKADSELFTLAQWSLFGMLRKNISTQSAKNIINALQNISKADATLTPDDNAYLENNVDWKTELQNYLTNQSMSALPPRNASFKSIEETVAKGALLGAIGTAGYGFFVGGDEVVGGIIMGTLGGALFSLFGKISETDECQRAWRSEFFPDHKEEGATEKSL